MTPSIPKGVALAFADASLVGRALALNAAVTLSGHNEVSVCGSGGGCKVKVILDCDDHHGCDGDDHHGDGDDHHGKDGGKKSKHNR